MFFKILSIILWFTTFIFLLKLSKSINEFPSLFNLNHNLYNYKTLSLNDNSEECNNNDFNYYYTECDSKNKRWRFAVPKQNKKHCQNIQFAMPNLNCSIVCSAGKYFEMQSQSCRLCPAGTYSLGNGVRYEQMTQMPYGFSVKNYPNQLDQIIYEKNKKMIVCPEELGWIIQNGELRYLPTPCVSKLSISLNLLHDGYIQFYYKMPKNSRSLFNIIQVQNAFCQSYGNSHKNLFQTLPIFTSDEGFNIGLNNENNFFVAQDELNIRRLHVRSGQNLVTWTVSSNRDKTTFADIINIPKIDISGLGSTPVCTSCPAGTFSLEGSQYCELCKINTFSEKRSSICQKCLETEYSGIKATKCLKRPPCSEFDVYRIRDSKCVKNCTKQIVKLKCVQPNICLNNTKNYKNICSGFFEEECLPCRVGMARNLNTGFCEYCKNGEYSKDGIECKKCPENTLPDYGLYYNRWDYLPEEIETTCEYIFAEQEECKFNPTWIPFGDRIESAQTRLRGVALNLIIQIKSGFYNPLRMGGMLSKPTHENPIAQVHAEIELKCPQSKCQLYFVQERINTSSKNRFNVIASFNNTQKRTKFTHSVLESHPTRFILIFMRSDVELENDSLNDRAILYSLNITYTGNSTTQKFTGGGQQCIVCPLKNQKTNECQSCPPGHYLNKNNFCIKCPFGSVLKLSSTNNESASCKKCGLNLGSEDSTRCEFSGRFELPSKFFEGKKNTNTTMKFDMTQLKDHVLTAEGARIFAKEGNPYYHSFNFNIFGNPVPCHDTFDSMSELANNSIDSIASELEYMSLESNDVLFCRSVAILSQNYNFEENNNQIEFNKTNNNTKTDDLFFISSTIIARRIGAVTPERSFKGFYLTNKQLEYDSSLSLTVRPIDIHVFYEPMQTHLSACPIGMIGIVTLRCEPTTVSKPLVRLSRNCPDGTCDGCLYHIIVESASACPICDKNSYQEIKSECINNWQKIHYIPLKHCVLFGIEKHERIELCTTLTKNLFLLFSIAAFIIVLLIIGIILIYKKNKKLEYRYMRIIEGKDDIEFNSCALKSDDDEDEVNEKNLSQTRVFFEKKKNFVSLSKKELTNNNELINFLSESSENN